MRERLIRKFSTDETLQPGTARRTHSAAWVLCLLVFAILVIAELFVRYDLGKISRIEGRVETEYRNALLIRSSAAMPRKVLLIGNSLLLEGVDFPELRAALMPDIDTTRFVVEQTTWLDWFYCMRLLYSRGAKPDFVAVNLPALHLAGNEIRGDYFAYRMMRTVDFSRASHDAGLSATATFSLLLGNLSALYGTRSETRKVLLSRTLPAIDTLATYLVPLAGSGTYAPLPTIDLVSRRLRIFDQMVRARGGRSIFIAPANLDPRNTDYLLEAGRLTGVPVIVPMNPGTLSSGDFRDGFHLNPAAASRYTEKLIPLLRKKISNLSN